MNNLVTFQLHGELTLSDGPGATVTTRIPLAD